jgi:competence protein ComEC
MAPIVRPFPAGVSLGRVAGHERRGLRIAFGFGDSAMAAAFPGTRHMKRPLLMVGLVYAVGILLGDLIAVSPNVLLGIALGLAAAALAWSPARAVLLWPLILITGWTNLTLNTVILSPHDLRNILGPEPELVTVRGILRDTPSLRFYEQDEKETWRTVAQLEVSAVRPNRQSWRTAEGKLAITAPGMLTNFFAGQTVEINGIARLPKAAAAEGTFDYRAYLRELGIYYQLRTASEQDWRILSSPSTRPLADRFRAWASKALALGLPYEDESLRLEWALTLGWKTALTEEVSEPFVQAATYHIFAVDGLRMAIIFGIFLGLLRALGLPRAICGLVLLPVIWFYTALTGWPASAIRATVMLSVVIIGWSLKRPSDLINSLFVAALIILVWQPQQLFQAGFQLSFLVVLCIILTMPLLERFSEQLMAPDPLLPESLRPRWQKVLRTPLRHIRGLLLTSLAAWLGALPLVAYYFNIVTPVSTPANILAVPLCGLVLTSNLASLLLAGWWPGAAELFNYAGWFLMECIRVSSQWFANWPAAYYYVSAPRLFTTCFYYAVLLAVVTGFLFKPALRGWKIAGICLGVGIWCLQFWKARSAVHLCILALNGGSATYVNAPGVKNDLLIDCGATNAAKMITKPFLRAQGVNHLPALLLTHGDLRHVGAAQMVAGLFSVNHILASPVRSHSPVYRHSLEGFERIPGRVRIISRDEVIGPWKVLHPGADDHFAQADDNAVVLASTFYGTRILLLSDLGRPGQKALLERMPDLRADIVVTGIPSAGEPLSDPLLDAINPRLIIVSDSEFPTAARASSKVRDRVARRKIPVIYLRTDGSTTIELRKSGWEVRTMSGMKIVGRSEEGQAR